MCTFSLSYFEDITETVEKKLKAAEVPIWNVRNPFSKKTDDTIDLSGLLVECDDVECIFEFRMFQYKVTTSPAAVPPTESVYSTTPQLTSVSLHPSNETRV